MAFARDDLAGRERPTEKEAPSSQAANEELGEEDGTIRGTRTEPIGRLFHTRQTLQIRMARIPSEVHRWRRTHHHHYNQDIHARQVSETAPSVTDKAAVPTGTGVFAGVLEPLTTITGGVLGDPVQTVIDDPTSGSSSSLSTVSTSSTSTETDTSPITSSVDELGPRTTEFSDIPPISSSTTAITTDELPPSGPEETTPIPTPIEPTTTLLSDPGSVVPPIATESPLTTITTYLTVPANATYTTIPAPRTITTGRTVILTSFRPRPSTIKSDSKSTSKATSLSSTRTFTTTTGTSVTTATISFTDAPGFGEGAGGIPAPIESAEPSSGGSSSGLGPTQTKLLGGILGGVAGLALLLIAFLFLIKKYKRQTMLQRVDEAGYGGPLEAAPGTYGSETAERSSFAPFQMAGSFLARQRHSPGAVPTSSEAGGGEKGFYKVSGRKLPPAIGGVRPDFSPHNAGSASGGSPQPGRSFSAGPLAPMTTTTTAPSTPPPFGISVKTPTPTSEKDFESAAFPRPAPPPMVRRQTDTPSGSPTLQRPAFPRLGNSADGLGRSLVAQDGSRGSRFTEDVT